MEYVDFGARAWGLAGDLVNPDPPWAYAIPVAGLARPSNWAEVAIVDRPVPARYPDIPPDTTPNPAAMPLSVGVGEF